MEFLDSASVADSRKRIAPGQSVMLILENLVIRHAGYTLKFYDESMVELAFAQLPCAGSVLVWVEEDAVKVKYPLPEEEGAQTVFSGGYADGGGGFGLISYSLATGKISQREPAGY